jgi:hypothetical protein
MGSSISSATTFAGAAEMGRLSGDSPGTMQAASIFQAGAAAYNAQTSSPQRWGDYSYTTVDPADDMTMWTIQEFTNATNSWGTQVLKLLAPPPATPASAHGLVLAGQCSQTLLVTGTSTAGSGFFDPGPTYPDHLTASATGGIAVNRVTYVDPTHLQLQISTVGVAPGTYNLTVTNPDGQSVTATNLITVSGSAPTAPAVASAVSALQYTLKNSDGSTWQEIDPGLRITCAPGSSQLALLTANSDLWTANAGFNQDIGIFVSDNGGADQLLGWKESGGFAGTFSPNAAYVQAGNPSGNGLFPMSSGHTYVFKLEWKTNKPASGSTIFAGAGPINGLFSPTSLMAKFYSPAGAPSLVRSTVQYTLTSSDGSAWHEIDPANLSTTLTPASNGIAVVGANADLWTSQAGINQDIAVFATDLTAAGPPQLVTWKESGGFAGTFSPNAAFARGTIPVTGGHSYYFSLYLKANKPAAGATIWVGAGPIASNYSPTSLLIDTEPSTSVFDHPSTSQYQLANSDGASWVEMDPALRETVAPTSDVNSVIGANADLWTSQAGYNQDIAIFVSDNGGPDQLLAWKESGGFAGTFSPNAAYAQASLPLVGGHTYVFKLMWKTNKPASGATIWTGAGPIHSLFSPTRLTVELTD